MINTSIIEIKEEDLHIVDSLKRNYLNNLTYGWKSHVGKSYDFGHWNREILLNSKVIPFDLDRAGYLDADPSLKALWQIIKEAIPDRCLYRVYVNGYTYGTDAYSHVDDPWMRTKVEDSKDETAILYLNESWNKDWQGETVIFNSEDEIETSILPKYGRILIFDSSKFHAARSVSRACSELRSVFVIKTFDKRLESKEADFIFELSGDNKHSGKTFFQHLFNTALIAERSKADKEVILASLYHSIYETEFYKWKGKKPSRKEVREMIGEYAEELVYEFCSLKNRFETIYNNTKDYSKKMHKDMLMIELSNLHEQNKNGNYTEKILKLKEVFNSL